MTRAFRVADRIRPRGGRPAPVRAQRDRTRPEVVDTGDLTVE